MRRRLLLAASGLGPLALAGCAGGLLPAAAAPPLRFTLGPGTPPAEALAPRPGARRTLLVAPTRPAPGYEGEQMLYVQRSQTLAPFAYHAWVAPPAQLLAPLIAQALQDSGAFLAVLPASSSGMATWRLETELVQLHQEFGVLRSHVQMALQVRLIDQGTRQVVAAREIRRRVAAASEDPVAGAAAARLATQQVLAELAEFCAAEAAR